MNLLFDKKKKQDEYNDKINKIRSCKQFYCYNKNEMWM